MRKGYLICLLVATWGSAPSAAADVPERSPAGLALEIGFGLGGSNVLTPAITGDNTHNNYQVDAGDAEFIDLRFIYYPDNGPIGLGAALGYSNTGEQGICVSDYGNLCMYDLQRETGDLLLSYRPDDVSAVALGRTFHRNIILSSSDDEHPFPDVDFGNAAGWFVQYKHRFGNGSLGIRYTHLIYHALNTGAFANASSIGVVFSLDLGAH